LLKILLGTDKMFWYCRERIDDSITLRTSQCAATKKCDSHLFASLLQSLGGVLSSRFYCILTCFSQTKTTVVVIFFCNACRTSHPNVQLSSVFLLRNIIHTHLPAGFYFNQILCQRAAFSTRARNGRSAWLVAIVIFQLICVHPLSVEQGIVSSNSSANLRRMLFLYWERQEDALTFECRWRKFNQAQNTVIIHSNRQRFIVSYDSANMQKHYK